MLDDVEPLALLRELLRLGGFNVPQSGDGAAATRVYADDDPRRAMPPVCMYYFRTLGLLHGLARTLRYGGDTAGDMLITYGFVQEPVEAVAAFSFDIPYEDVYIQEKEDALQVGGGVGLSGSWLLAESSDGGEEPLPADLLAFLRMKHLGGADGFLLGRLLVELSLTFKPPGRRGPGEAGDR